MRLLEYQCKKVLGSLGLRMSHPIVARNAEEASDAARGLATPVVIKAQVPFGGRGKLGAVRFADTPEEAAIAARTILNLALRGVEVKQVSIEPRVDFSREIYLGATWDTRAKMPVMILNTHGGIDVESAHAGVFRAGFDPVQGLSGFRARELVRAAGFAGKSLLAVAEFAQKIAQAFVAIDAVTLEVNPLVELPDGSYLGLDAHAELDDDALFRQSSRLSAVGIDASAGDVSSSRPATALELEARRIDAMDHRGVAGRVVEFDGSLALLIGGGGASLTVFDAIGKHGGKPANYCEIGGNPVEEKVAALTHLLMSKPGVKKLAVIMNVVNNTRADVIARGVIMGLERAGRKPAETISVFRIPGSWEQEADALLAAVGVKAFGRETSLDQAARIAVEGMCHVA